MNKGKGMEVTKGSNGRIVKLRDKTKHVQVLRGIILKVLLGMVTEPETVDEVAAFFIYHDHLLQKLEAMGERDPVSKINQLIDHGYLVYRTTAPDAISYYVFKYKSHGLEFRRRHPKAA